MTKTFEMPKERFYPKFAYNVTDMHTKYFQNSTLYAVEERKKVSRSKYLILVEIALHF